MQSSQFVDEHLETAKLKSKECVPYLLNFYSFDVFCSYPSSQNWNSPQCELFLALVRFLFDTSFKTRRLFFIFKSFLLRLLLFFLLWELMKKTRVIFASIFFSLWSSCGNQQPEDGFAGNPIFSSLFFSWKNNFLQLTGRTPYPLADRCSRFLSFFLSLSSSACTRPLQLCDWPIWHVDFPRCGCVSESMRMG